MNDNSTKESLLSLANKLSKRQVFTLFVMLMVGWFISYQALPYFERRSEQEDRVAQKAAEKVIFEQEKYRKLQDSISLAKQMEKHKQTFINIDKIYDLMADARRKIPSANTIAVYYLHDSGGVPISGSPLNITVLYEASDKYIPSLKKDWQSQPLPEGYFHYNKFIYHHGYKYVNNVENYAKIYHGETKSYLEMYDTKALYGILLEQSTAGTYYLSLGFPKEDPLLKDKLIEGNIKRIASLIRPLLQVREAPLK